MIGGSRTGTRRFAPRGSRERSIRRRVGSCKGGWAVAFPLPQCRIDMAFDDQIIDPDVGRSRSSVHIQEQRVEIGLAVIHFRPELQPQDMDMPGQEFLDLLDLQLLPPSDVRIASPTRTIVTARPVLGSRVRGKTMRAANRARADPT